MINNSINALDLSQIGVDFDALEVGNYYPVIHRLLGVDHTVRLIEKSIKIENPDESSVSLGEKKLNIKDYQIEMEKQTKSFSQVNSQLSSTIVQVQNVTTLANNTADNVVKINQEIIDMGTSSGVALEAMAEAIKNINTTVTSIQSDITTLKTNVTTINKSINDINKVVKSNTARIEALEKK